MRLSANLGFLLNELALPAAIRQAARLGFSAVECHWPYDTDPAEVAAALDETSLPMLGLNTARGDVAAGEFGLAALPGREADARRVIDQAIDYADRIGCRNVHVMAGKAGGPEARAAFIENLRYAADRVAETEIGILIEPINTRDLPGYFLQDVAGARDIVEAVSSPAVRIMFDCYHMQVMGGDLLHSIRDALPIIGHIQFASVPDRAEPDHGEVDYGWLLPAIRDLGYEGWFGAEYRPVSNSFAWMAQLTG